MRLGESQFVPVLGHQQRLIRAGAMCFDKWILIGCIGALIAGSVYAVS